MREEVTRMPDKFPFLNMVRLMPGGSIHLGCMEPHQNIVMAYTSPVMDMPMLAVLKWKEGEDLDQVLTRLDRAVGDAMRSKKPVNELGEVVMLEPPSMQRSRR